MTDKTQSSETIRLDKWLWAARFFKTRQLAGEAIKGGKVHLNGQRTKPGKSVRTGSKLRIHKGSLEWDIEIAYIPQQRRPASEARTFYIETDESYRNRQEQMQEQKRIRASIHHPRGFKPTKRDRRLIRSFTGKKS